MVVILRYFREFDGFGRAVRKVVEDIPNFFTTEM